MRRHDREVRLPEHPRLRELAEAFERAQIAAEIYDHNLQVVYISTEEGRLLGASEDSVEDHYGLSQYRRYFEFPDAFVVTREGSEVWMRTTLPIYRALLGADSPHHDEVFGRVADLAREVPPAVDPPYAWTIRAETGGEAGVWREWQQEVDFLHFRLHDDDGSLLGVVMLPGPRVPHGLLPLLARGDVAMMERMADVASPERRSAAVLFADLAASGPLSRSMSSRAYFGVIRALTDLIDSCVAQHGGITGKHAGDGASALFLTDHFVGSEAAAAAAAIGAARAITEGSDGLPAGDAATDVNIGLHWGATLMVGQVATTGRLEVTALGDAMNEAARIQEAATGGGTLVSKPLLERLDPQRARDLGLDPDGVVYTPVGDLPDVSEKARRDAGGIAVAAV